MLAPQDMDILEATRDTVFARLETLGKTFKLQEAAPAALGFARAFAQSYVELVTAKPEVLLELAATGE